jgi:hypothetical protein
VNDFKPKTLHDSIDRTWDMEGLVPNTNNFSKPFTPHKGKDKKPPVKKGT